MNEKFTYQDPKTGYTITQYTRGPLFNTKLYFTTENFTSDDQYFFFNKEASSDGNTPGRELHRAHVESGEIEKVAGSEYTGFAMSRNEDYGVMTKGDIVCRYDVKDNKITEIGELPKGGRITGHLTTSKSGLIVCSYHQANKIFALVVMDPETGKSEVVHQSDYHLGHCQACPGDDETIFYIHETMGDALQRMWMFNTRTGENRPYYVEQEGDWITHEVWSADGEYMIFMRLPHEVKIGTKDGYNFRTITHNNHHMLHPGVSRDMKWFCADSINYWDYSKDECGIWLINGETGGLRFLASTGAPATGNDHQHPSFNHKGDKILFSNPDPETGVSQVALVDLNQVERP